MVMAAKAPLPNQPEVAPHSELAAHLIERHYQAMGCDRWNTRLVQLLCAKLGDTPTKLAARLRIRPGDMARRMEVDCWTRQDGLILTMLEREIDFMRGCATGAGRLIP